MQVLGDVHPNSESKKSSISKKQELVYNIQRSMLIRKLVKMTCRDEVIDAMVRLENRHGKSIFQLSLIVNEVLSHTNEYEESTIRTHISARMCAQAPANHAVVTDDLDRVGRGLYKLRHGSPK